MTRRLLVPAAAFAALALSAASAGDAAPHRMRRAARIGTRAFDSVQQAIDAALPGERVIVGRGVFRERLAIAKAITLVGRRTVLDGVVGGIPGPCVAIASDDVRIQGVTFRNGTDQVVGDGDGLALVRCASVNAGGSAVDVVGDGVVVDACSFVGATADAVVVTGNSPRVTRSTFRNVGAGAATLRGDDALVQRCTVRASAAGVALDVVGDRATVFRTSVIGGAGDLIAVDGESALVDLCETVGSGNGDGISVLGDRAEVVRCFSSAVGAGISVRGNEAIVDRNDVRYVRQAGVTVVGDAATIRSNSVLLVHGNQPGILWDRAAGVGGAAIESNDVVDCASEGIRADGPGAALRDNFVLGCGNPGTSSVVVAGDDCFVERGTVREGAANAMLLSGDRCTVTDAFVIDAARDGFLVLGDGCRLTGVEARRCGAEGIENGGGGTVVEGSTFLGNRLDVAIRAGLPFGSFGTDNRFETGGPSIVAEIP